MRIEKDSMGGVELPDAALYGASTQRAVINFPISGLRFSGGFIKALGVIKWAAAKTNLQLGLMAPCKAEAIIQAAWEVAEGQWCDQFVVDVFQTGSGTSTNMNANEVIANRAIEILGGSRGDKKLVHPNDDVNMCQSSNDVIPSAIHIAAFDLLEKLLLPALNDLKAALHEKAGEFCRVVKAGRTHLQDATPVTLGHEFGGYAAQVEAAEDRIKNAQKRLRFLALGGTAVGTGLNAHPGFAQGAIRQISQATKHDFHEAPNHFQAQGACDCLVELSGQLKAAACALMKIANDLRWLASGPRCGLREIQLPEVQPGSSIMPAKVNPVICESVMMAAAQVIGNDTVITIAAQHGNFELNTMLPAAGYNLLQAIEILAGAARNFAERCVKGVRANVDRCRDYAERTAAVCAALAPAIGYDQAAEVAHRAFLQNKTVYQAALEMKVLDAEKLSALLDPNRLAGLK